tara:strand:+ start:1780 stop:1959 length:180 start_codon:yes stop_codon:yes gene_type:complete
MMDFLKNYGSRLILFTPFVILSIDWLIDGKIIAFILTTIFIVVIVALWEEPDEISDEEE